ncbi:SpoIIIAH-like family protein [Cytobacillus purgationiresistens]|uniref:Stage III sporulation protein AH n=1 Tax=Cytobacillus purgationiresistens TaxID=863449 RepID=A0ABU0ADR7_9BACI|nr:SpoIIIAH-like family protein [Cytobacillus purgationiresistens]MDQ0269396.1 stage III sporulation protein AH [Cytobacillus purgationiresistens]
MLLKKQTVWLLTMLSLVVVLSVYYVTSDGKSNLATTDQEESKAGEETAKGDEDIISSVSGDEAFEEKRLTQMDERSKMREDLTEVAGSTDLPAEEISAAKDQLDQLDEIAQKEELLETMIKAMDYEDVLVQADGNNVKITVKADEPSRTQANKIIQEVKNELGKLEAVAVEFQVKK